MVINHALIILCKILIMQIHIGKEKEKFIFQLMAYSALIEALTCPVWPWSFILLQLFEVRSWEKYFCHGVTILRSKDNVETGSLIPPVIRLFHSLPAQPLTAVRDVQQTVSGCLTHLPLVSHICQWTGSPLVQVMAWRQTGEEPLPEPILIYCQLDP